jgi:hypothetical protein
VAYVSNFKWDIFISYAHADREATPSGWISNLHDALKLFVEKGIEGSVEIFFDQITLRHNMTVAEIDREVTQSAVIVLFASPNWIRSKNCQNEFRAMMNSSGDHSRAFVIEIEPPTGNLRFPDIINELIRVKLFKTVGDFKAPIVLKPDEDGFHEAMYKLGFEIRSKLNELRENQNKKPGINANKSIVIASCAHEIANAKKQLIDYLSPQVPAIEILNFPQGGNKEAYAKVVRDKLSGAKVFVQLLGPDACQSCDPELSATQIEYEAAREAGVPIILWRPNWLDPQGIADPAHRSLVLEAQNGPAVPELANAVLEEVRRVDAKPSGPMPVEPHYILVSSAPEDSSLAGELVNSLNELDVMACKDDMSHPEKAREVWANCDAIAFLQAQSDPITTFARLQAIHGARAAAQTQKRLLGQATVYGPPPPKTASIGGARMAHIDLSEDWRPDRFSEWVRSILPSEGS